MGRTVAELYSPHARLSADESVRDSIRLEGAGCRFLVANPGVPVVLPEGTLHHLHSWVWVATQ